MHSEVVLVFSSHSVQMVVVSVVVAVVVVECLGGGGLALDLGGGATLLEGAAPATQMLCWQTCPQAQSESVMQPTLVTD